MQAPEQTSSSSSGGPPLRDSQDSDAEAMASGGASVRTITCVVVGDAAVGKTSLLTALTIKDNSGMGRGEQGMEYHKKVPLIGNDGEVEETVYLRLIDTPGEMHDTRGPKHYPSADVFLICFSIISPTSVHSVLDRWVPGVRQANPKAPIVLVGMKVDLRHDADILRRLAERNFSPVTEQQGQELQQQIGALEYFEITTSEIEVLDLLATEVVRGAVGKPKPRKGGKKDKQKKDSKQKSSGGSKSMSGSSASPKGEVRSGDKVRHKNKKGCLLS